MTARAAYSSVLVVAPLSVHPGAAHSEVEQTSTEGQKLWRRAASRSIANLLFVQRSRRGME